MERKGIKLPQYVWGELEAFGFDLEKYPQEDIERLMRTAREANPDMEDEEIKAAIDAHKRDE